MWDIHLWSLQGWKFPWSFKAVHILLLCKCLGSSFRGPLKVLELFNYFPSRSHKRSEIGLASSFRLLCNDYHSYPLILLSIENPKMLFSDLINHSTWSRYRIRQSFLLPTFSIGDINSTMQGGSCSSGGRKFGYWQLYAHKHPYKRRDQFEWARQKKKICCTMLHGLKNGVSDTSMDPTVQLVKTLTLGLWNIV